MSPPVVSATTKPFGDLKAPREIQGPFGDLKAPREIEGRGPLLALEPASEPVVLKDFNEGWGFGPAPLFCNGAARVESAAPCRTDLAGDLSLQINALAFLRRISLRHCRKQGPGVGMKRVAEEGGSFSEFYNLPEIHDGHMVTEVPDQPEIV